MQWNCRLALAVTVDEFLLQICCLGWMMGISFCLAAWHTSANPWNKQLSRTLMTGGGSFEGFISHMFLLPGTTSRISLFSMYDEFLQQTYHNCLGWIMGISSWLAEWWVITFHTTSVSLAVCLLIYYITNHTAVSPIRMACFSRWTCEVWTSTSLISLFLRER